MITKETIIESIEILQDGTVQIGEKTRYMEDGVILSESNSDRRTIEPGGNVTKENKEVQNIVSLVQTPERISVHDAKKKAQVARTQKTKEI